MTDERPPMHEIERRQAEVDDLWPYVQLAREIKAEVAQVAAGDGLEVDSLVEVIERIPRQARQDVVLRIFGQLPAEVQWELVARVFGDEEIARYLRAEHRWRQDAAGRALAVGAVVAVARQHGELDVGTLPAGTVVVLGLFLEAQVRAALARGEESDSCARRLALQAAAGHLRVVADEFNPRGGFFSSQDYDRERWQAERLDAHALVRLGAIATGPDGDDFSAVLYPGGRVDVEVGGACRRGRLHLGWIKIAETTVFET